MCVQTVIFGKLVELSFMHGEFFLSSENESNYIKLD